MFLLELRSIWSDRDKIHKEKVQVLNLCKRESENLLKREKRYEHTATEPSLKMDKEINLGEPGYLPCLSFFCVYVCGQGRELELMPPQILLPSSKNFDKLQAGRALASLQVS